MKVLKLQKELAYMMCGGFVKGFPVNPNVFLLLDVL